MKSYMKTLSKLQNLKSQVLFMSRVVFCSKFSSYLLTDSTSSEVLSPLYLILQAHFSPQPLFQGTETMSHKQFFQDTLYFTRLKGKRVRLVYTLRHILAHCKIKVLSNTAAQEKNSSVSQGSEFLTTASMQSQNKAVVKASGVPDGGCGVGFYICSNH